MTTLVVSHRVPLPGESDRGALMFCQWLPEGSENGLRVNSGGLALHVWLDRTCVRSMEPITDDLVSRWVNMPVEQLFVDVTVENASSELAGFIIANEHWPRVGSLTDSPDADTRRLAAEYTALGWKVLAAVLDATNRIIAWAYAEKAHYWLKERDAGATAMMSRNNQFHASVTIEGSNRVRWCPPYVDSFRVSGGNTSDSLGLQDWQKLQTFLDAGRRGSLFRDVMSNALALHAVGHNRAAVIESISALELSFHAFARSPDPSRLQSTSATRTGDLKATIDHLGFTASMRYLLPIVVRDCGDCVESHSVACEAIETRNNIVHNGQRNVETDRVAGYMRATSSLSERLAEWTLPNAA